MSSLLWSLLLYTVPAVLVGWTVVYRGKSAGLSWHPLEYALIFLPWPLMRMVAIIFFGSLDQALGQSAFVREWYVLFSIVAGVLGGLSLAARLIFRNARLPGLAITALAAGLLSIFNMQFDILIALFLVPPG
ncbi:MAG: hypothetical protein R8K46_06800 [Mariprofundaceae bacterium]